MTEENKFKVGQKVWVVFDEDTETFRHTYRASRAEESIVLPAEISHEEGEESGSYRINIWSDLKETTEDPRWTEERFCKHAIFETRKEAIISAIQEISLTSTKNMQSIADSIAKISDALKAELDLLNAELLMPEITEHPCNGDLSIGRTVWVANLERWLMSGTILCGHILALNRFSSVTVSTKTDNKHAIFNRDYSVDAISDNLFSTKNLAVKRIIELVKRRYQKLFKQLQEDLYDENLYQRTKGQLFRLSLELNATKEEEDERI